ncbi:MAG: hypothetical protein KDI15_11885, partial [Thiothrix sp.]|nr:hypothetical protein [Thiothrix sp.]
MNNRKWLLAGYLALLPLWAGANTLEALARDLHLDPARISVSGLSSGAFMANQLHVAHSARLMGAAIIAGGPYRCAAGHYPGSWPGLPGLYTATVVCSRTAPGANLVPAPAPDVAFSVEETRRLAREELIDDPAHLAGSRVWLFSGTRDRTVPTAIVDTLEQYYRTFVPAGAIERLRDLPAGHAMITANYGNACVLSAPPYLNDCDFDAAASLLSQLYGPLQPKGDMDADALFTFRQD